MHKWRALIVLALAQFLMVLDQAVMNVSISQLVEDFDTSVTTIQAVITAYALVMAALMLTGGKIGDIIGRRRAFTVGLVIYGVGSAFTAISQTVPMLLIGWSFLEGVGAALVLPALVALVAANYEGRDRVTAFGVIGGVSGVGIAAGPIIGGFFTTNLSWRWVFVGEVILVIAIILLVRWIADAALEGRKPQLDWVGSVLSASGLAIIVYAMLEATTWGWIRPKSSPIEPFGFALTPFAIIGGFVLLALFAKWERHRVAIERDPLVKMTLFSITAMRSGLGSLFAQNVILLGIFFTLPLYLQVVLGMDALETGIRMLPISIAMFAASASGPALAARFSPRRIVQGGFVTLVLAAFMMLATVEPELQNFTFGLSLAVLGAGMGLVASQLGNVIQSSVGAEDRGEAGGLQNTSQQIGSAVGTALIGAVVISALVGIFVDNIESDPRIDQEITAAIGVELNDGATFATADAVEQSLLDAGIDSPTIDALIENYQDAQIDALKAGLLIAAIISLCALWFTSGLPPSRIDHRPVEAT